MLDVADDVLGLQALHHVSNHFAGEDWILTQVFEGAAIARLAGQIHASTQRHVEALRPQLAPDQSSVFVGRIQIPTRRAGEIAGQSGRVTTVLTTASYTVPGVRHLDIGNA